MLKRLLTSRKFLTAIGAVIVTVGVAAYGWLEPEAEAAAEQIITAVVVLAGLFIGGTALEDAAKKLGEKPE